MKLTPVFLYSFQKYLAYFTVLLVSTCLQAQEGACETGTVVFIRKDQQLKLEAYCYIYSGDNLLGKIAKKLRLSSQPQSGNLFIYTSNLSSN